MRQRPRPGIRPLLRSGRRCRHALVVLPLALALTILGACTNPPAKTPTPGLQSALIAPAFPPGPSVESGPQARGQPTNTSSPSRETSDAPLLTDTEALRRLNWTHFLNTPSLRPLLDSALARNRDLRIALLNVEQAAAQLALRQADLLPTVGVGLTASNAPTVTGTSLRSIATGLQFSAWELDLFGRLAGLTESARAQVLSSEAAREAAQVTLIAAVASSWLNLVADDELIALTRQTLASREESLRLTQLRFDHGTTSELELRQAHSLAESARATLAQQLRNRALNRNALTLLVGDSVELPSLEFTLTQISLPEVPEGLPASVLLSRPDVRQAEHALAAAQANIDVARAAFFPKVSLTAGFGTLSKQITGLFAGGSWGVTLAPQLFQPIFDSGRNQAALDSANVAREVAWAQYERAVQAAYREASDALSGRKVIAEQLEALHKVADAEGARLRLSTLRYENGVASSLDLLDAQRSHFAARQAVIQTRLLLLQNQLSVYRALGGGTAPR